MLTQQEICALRTLALQYAEISSIPEQALRKKRWLSLNSLHMERPLVLIDQIPWNEMDIGGELENQVSDPYWRRVETALLRTLYKWRHMPADMVLDDYICLPRPIASSGWGICAEADTLSQEDGSDIRSSHFHNQIREEEDLEKIVTPRLTLDSALEEEIIRTASQLFDGIIPYKMTGITMHLGIWDSITMWMGVENCYIELMDRPEMMHRLMEKVTGGLLSMIRQANGLKGFDLHTHLCHCSHTYLNDLPKDEEAVSQNAWAFGMAQLFTSVSPAITAEFEVAYMKRIFPLFGAVYYGCCDRLDDRLSIIEQLPNVRKISCSPWSDRERFAANLDKNRYVMSCKPTPAYLAAERLDEDLIRSDLRRTLSAAKSHQVNLEFILKDISTVCHRPQNLWRWAQIAMEETAR